MTTSGINDSRVRTGAPGTAAALPPRHLAHQPGRAGHDPVPVGPGADRLVALDGLRLAAALAVAGFHYVATWSIDGRHRPGYFFPHLVHPASYGFLGVDLFFVISGFAICMSAWGRGLGEFFTSRVARLYPAYWFALVAVSLVLVGWPVLGGPQSIPVLLANATMLQNPLGAPEVNAVSWTLWVEIRFYLLFAVVVWRGVTYRRVVLFCALWLAAAIIGPSVGSLLVDQLVVPDYAPYFVAGVALYLVRRYRPSALLLGLVGFAWLVAMFKLRARIAVVDPGWRLSWWWAAALVTAGYAVLLVIALGGLDRIRWPGLVLAGNLTYPFYLLHQRIGYSAMRTLYPVLPVPVWALVGGTTVAVLAASWLVYRFVERPLSALIRPALRRGFARLHQDWAGRGTLAGRSRGVDRPV